MDFHVTGKKVPDFMEPHQENHETGCLLLNQYRISGSVDKEGAFWLLLFLSRTSHQAAVARFFVGCYNGFNTGDEIQ
jgi:hypothetical protein